MLKKINYLLLVIFINTYGFANNNICIRVKVVNGDENTPIVLLQYNYEVKQIAKTVIKSETFCFNNLNNLNDGVYSIIINYPESKFNNKQPAYQFDIIIDKSENEIEIELNPSISKLPLIKKSKVNSNYYEYLQLENEKINDIENLKYNTTTGDNDILDKIKKKLNECKKKYIVNNFNKWSTALVQNSTSLQLINSTSKIEYWSLFQTNNPDLINTPILERIIQNYVIQYYNNADEEGFKEAFNEIIKQFSENKITKEWVVKHVITGLNQLGNKDLEAYFSVKYKYKT